MSTTPPPTPGVAQHTLADRQTLPGLLPNETVIFKAWWALHNTEYTGYDFNVRVGSGFDPGDAFDEATRKSAIDSTKKRIDALLWRGDQPVIVEVKFRGTPPVIGQMVCYRLLWAREYPGKPSPILLLLCCQLDADTRYCLDQLGIGSEIVYCDLSGLKVVK